MDVTDSVKALGLFAAGRIKVDHNLLQKAETTGQNLFDRLKRKSSIYCSIALVKTMGFSPSHFRCYSFFIIPAKAGIQELSRGMDPRLREDDGRSVMLLFVRDFQCIVVQSTSVKPPHISHRNGQPVFRVGRS